MIDLNTINNGSIIICPSSVKKELIKIKSLLNVDKDIKFMSKEDLFEGFYFSYDVAAIYYLHHKYHYDYSLCEEILNNLHNISPINNKLKKLQNIYQDLCDNKLLKFNPYFKYLFNNKKIYILEYPSIDVELNDLVKKLSSDFEYINNDDNDDVNNNLECFTFDDIEEEVNYVMTKIGQLIESGVSLNNIYFYTIPSEYKLILKKAFNYHNIILDCSSDLYIYDTPIFKEYLRLLNDYSFVDAYSELIKKVSYDPQDVLGVIVDLIIEVTSLKIDKEEQIEVLCYLAGNKKVPNLEYTNSIKEINSSQSLSSDDYCFMLGFSLGVYPVIVKDTEFYLDSEKVLLNRNTSIIKNQINELNLINFIKKTKNLIITFKEKVGKSVYYPSLLIDKLKISKKPGVLSNVRYSFENAKFEVAKYYDLNRLYGVSNKWLNTFNKDELGFNTYNHQFMRFDSFDKEQELVLSYTQINNYNKCPFMYYLKHVLKVDEFIGDFSTEIGTLFHKILEDSNSKEINLDDYKDEVLKHFTTFKERYFAEKVLPQVLRVIKKNQEFHNVTELNKILFEEEFIVKLDEISSIMGRIDKFLIDEVSKTIAVVDYKTGSFKFDKKKVAVGLDLQLPLYAFLLSKKYPEYLIAGVYIQNVLLEKENIKDSDAYLLDGITINDLNLIKLIDPTLGTITTDDGKICPASQYIKSIKVTAKNALHAKSHVISLDDFSMLIETAEAYVNKVLKEIREGNFSISPICVDDSSLPCVYCKFGDICNHDYNDVRHVSIKERKE